MNKKVLKPESDFSFSLVGIISSLKDYRLAHFINKELGLSLVKNDRYPEYNAPGKGVDGFFALFTEFMEESETELFFFSNKGSGGFIIPEMKNFDHFLIINPGGDSVQKEILEGLSCLDRIEKANLLDVLRLKSRENLLFF